MTTNGLEDKVRPDPTLHAYMCERLQRAVYVQEDGRRWGLCVAGRPADQPMSVLRLR